MVLIGAGCLPRQGKSKGMEGYLDSNGFRDLEVCMIGRREGKLELKG